MNLNTLMMGTIMFLFGAGVFIPASILLHGTVWSMLAIFTAVFLFLGGVTIVLKELADNLDE